MAQFFSEITSVSSKGQLVLPVSIRNEMNIQPGTKFMVFSDGESILLKPIIEPNIAEVRSMMDAANKWAKEVDLTEADINSAIKNVRTRKKVTK